MSWVKYVLVRRVWITYELGWEKEGKSTSQERERERGGGSCVLKQQESYSKEERGGSCDIA